MYITQHGSGKSQHFRAVNQDTDLVLIQKEMRSKRFKVVYVVQREKKKWSVTYLYTHTSAPTSVCNPATGCCNVRINRI